MKFCNLPKDFYLQNDIAFKPQIIHINSLVNKWLMIEFQLKQMSCLILCGEGTTQQYKTN